MNLHEKIKLNKWDSIDDFLRVLQTMRQGKWHWMRNNRCKYVEVRVDMRDGRCIIRDRYGKRIDSRDLEYQYTGEHQTTNSSSING